MSENTKSSSENVLRYAKVVLLIGIPIILISPFIFTRSLGFVSFTETGQIGDTIGGLTAPIVNLIGAILVYFALYAQIEANKIVQNQIEEQKKDALESKNFNSLFEIFKQVKSDLDNFTVTKNVSTGSVTRMLKGEIQPNIVTYMGKEAIDNFFEKILLETCPVRKSDDFFVKDSKYLSFIDTLTVIELLTIKINSSTLSQIDRETLIELIKYLFNSKIKSLLPSEVACKFCNKAHNLLPDKLSEILNKINANLKQVT